MGVFFFQLIFSIEKKMFYQPENCFGDNGDHGQLYQLRTDHVNIPKPNIMFSGTIYNGSTSLVTDCFFPVCIGHNSSIFLCPLPAANLGRFVHPKKDTT